MTGPILQLDSHVVSLGLLQKVRGEVGLGDLHDTPRDGILSNESIRRQHGDVVFFSKSRWYIDEKGAGNSYRVVAN